ncbi:hypothetical protein CBR_g25792 [Chara braunii]|uniref:DUF659 domain-containing protein n=1 Tax=Chara braunii TaxID=69332 RepID=A0A388L6C9_CHABU|nr:hypothetical protein CBR_g25792 [Chara braunii]|eukprot:GBG77860.1 hypothetical protein CBR_g25792 [Chara braunii]
MMLRCSFCNKVFQGTQFQATRHFSQTNYWKDVSDEALYEIARRTQQKLEADQMERVARYAAECGLDVPGTGGARGGEAGRRSVDGGVGGDGGHGAADPTLGGGGGETEEGVINVDREARVPGEEGVSEWEDMPEFYPGTGERLEDWRRRAGKGAATEGSSKRKEGGSDPLPPQQGRGFANKSGVSFNAFRNRAWKAYQQVLLEQPGSSPRAVLPNHCEITSMRAVETHRAELAEELEEVRQPFWVTGATFLSDGRKLRDGRPIVNFLAAGSRGVVVYTTINREGEADDAVHVLRRWVTIFHEFTFGGSPRINVICTDSASAYVGAARALTSPFIPPALRRITWLLCSVHVCKKLLSKMGMSCDAFVDAITRACVLVVFFKTHQAALHFFRTRSPDKGLILSCETRFASIYSMLERLLAVQDTLQDMMRGDDARAFASILLSADVCVMACWVRRQIRWDPWWQRVATIVHIMQPIIELLRRMDRRGQYMSLMIEWTQDLVRHFTSCAPAERNWAVHEGIHTKKRNQLAFEKVVQLVEITANVQLTEYRRAGCGYVLPWQRDEGMLDSQAGLEFEPVHSGTRRGMTEEKIVCQVALITRDPIGASAPPSADAVFDRRDCIFCPYPREDDSYEEPIPEAADDPALRIPQISTRHTRIPTPRRRGHTLHDGQRTGRRGRCWGETRTFGAHSVRSLPLAALRRRRRPPLRRGGIRPCRHLLLRVLHHFSRTGRSWGPLCLSAAFSIEAGPVRQLRLRSPSLGILQEEGAPSAAAVESSVAPAAVPDATIAAAVEEIAAAAAASVLEEMAASVLEEDPPAAGVGAAVEGQVAAAGGAGGGAAAVEVEVAAAVEEEEAPSAAAVEEEIAAQAEVQRGGDDERLVQQFLTEELGPAIAGMTPGVARGFGISDSEMGTHLDLDLSMALPPSCSGATSTDQAPLRDEPPRQTSTQTTRERTMTESPDAARNIMERERARLLASTDPRAQAFARAVVEARRQEIGGDYVQDGVVAGEDVAEGVAAEPVPEAISGGAEAADVAVEGRPEAVDEAVQAGQRRVKEAIHARREVQEIATGTVVPHFAPQEVRRPLDAEELAREAVRDVTRLDRRIFDRRLEHSPWKSIPSVRWGPASPVWSGSTSTGGHTTGHVPGVSGGVTETAPRTGDMPPPPPRAPAGDPSSSPTARGSRSPHTPGRSRIRDTTAVQQNVSDMTIFGRTDIDLDSTRRVTEHTARLQPGLGGGGARTTAAREVPTSGCEPQRGRGRGVSTETLEYALRAATRVVQEQTPRKRGVPPRPRPMPAEGGTTLGESSGVEGLGMPRGSRREQTIAEASARVVVLRKRGGPVTIEEEDPNTDASVRNADEDYEGEEGGEEDSRSGSDGDDDDYDEPPPSPGPPPTRTFRRFAARTSSSSRGRKSQMRGAEHFTKGRCPRVTPEVLVDIWNTTQYCFDQRRERQVRDYMEYHGIRNKKDVGVGLSEDDEVQHVLDREGGNGEGGECGGDDDEMGTGAEGEGPTDDGGEDDVQELGASLQGRAFKWWYIGGVSFERTRMAKYSALTKHLQNMPRGMRPALPQFKRIAASDIQEERAHVADKLRDIREQMQYTRATILTDGRKSLNSEPIVNFLAAGQSGAFLFTTVRREGVDAETSNVVLQRWKKVFEKFGTKNINSICTDSASVYVAVGRALCNDPDPDKNVAQMTLHGLCVRTSASDFAHHIGSVFGGASSGMLTRAARASGEIEEGESGDVMPLSPVPRVARRLDMDPEDVLEEERLRQTVLRCATTQRLAWEQDTTREREMGCIVEEVTGARLAAECTHDGHADVVDGGGLFTEGHMVDRAYGEKEGARRSHSGWSCRGGCCGCTSQRGGATCGPRRHLSKRLLEVVPPSSFVPVSPPLPSGVSEDIGRSMEMADLFEQLTGQRVIEPGGVSWEAGLVAGGTRPACAGVVSGRGGESGGSVVGGGCGPTIVGRRSGLSGGSVGGGEGSAAAATTGGRGHVQGSPSPSSKAKGKSVTWSDINRVTRKLKDAMPGVTDERRDHKGRLTEMFADAAGWVQKGDRLEHPGAGSSCVTERRGDKVVAPPSRPPAAGVAQRDGHQRPKGRPSTRALPGARLPSALLADPPDPVTL